ncbi:MAG: hypothetical protein KGO80_01420 [Bacteroidetes bacterium]|jgi:hypothetical protein|nr:hypothetical protein [Bacteroidota bacterium]GDX41732.1 hypothetical protein LBMAG22_02610 [Bacteroidota bacterium]
MQQPLSNIASVLLGKSSVEECTLTEIKKLCADYPWLGTARLLLVHKLKAVQDPSWVAAYEQAQLFFPTTNWLNLLLDTSTQKSSSSQESIVAQSKTLSKEPLAFEPYHTIDYFASQGIQYKPEDQPADKFGQQLKSFTEWIKAMKRLPLSEMGKSIDPKEEKQVEQLAGNSLQQNEVITEAMAEIWIKQGNIAKAREIFSKLSLLEPSKSAYFANRIDELNASL